MTRLLIAFICSTIFAWGQLPDDFPWWDSPIAQSLKLSPEQQKQIRATVRQHRDRLIEQRAAVQKAEANLRDEMAEEQVNESRAMEAINNLIAARSELMRSVSQMSLKLRMILTADQWRELQRRRSQQRAAGGWAMPPGQRLQLQQRVRMLRQRLARGRITPAEREQLLKRLEEIERALEQGLAPAPPVQPAKPAAPAPPGA